MSRALATILISAALATTACTKDSPVPPWWGQAQSRIAELGGRPLIVGNWEGPYRPYVFERGGLKALLADSVEVPDELDLLSAEALGTDRVLMAGTRRGRPDHDLFLYDRAAERLLNLTETPGIDEGDFCVAPDGSAFSFRAGDRSAVARLGADGLEAIGGAAADPLGEVEPHAPLPRLHRCHFIDASTFLGVEREAGASRLQRCRIGEREVRCEPRAALDGLEALLRFLRLPEGPGLIARRRGASWRRAWRLDSALNSALPVAEAVPALGDVLDHDGRRARVGYQSRYRATDVEDPTAVVQTLGRVGSESFAIVATPGSGRALARLRDGRWDLVRHPASAEPAKPPAIEERWIEGGEGARYQAFLFGDPQARRIALWWHGGPHENISPRFNPYFQRLSELGFAVLAVNYPGSTGRGAGYEGTWRQPEVEDCIDAVWRHLAELRPSHVVSWSVSIGVRLQHLVLRRGHPLSGVVDQAGWKGTPLVALADARKLALFTIRGRFDANAPAERVSFEYEGGHDLQRGEDFVALFERLAPFLAELPPVEWPRPQA